MCDSVIVCDVIKSRSAETFRNKRLEFLYEPLLGSFLCPGLVPIIKSIRQDNNDDTSRAVTAGGEELLLLVLSLCGRISDDDWQVH